MEKLLTVRLIVFISFDPDIIHSSWLAGKPPIITGDETKLNCMCQKCLKWHAPSEKKIRVFNISSTQHISVMLFHHKALPMLG